MTNTTTTFQKIRRSALALVVAGGMVTSVVEAAAILGTVALVPVAMQLGVSSPSSTSAVAVAHAARQSRASDVANLAHASQAVQVAVG